MKRFTLPVAVNLLLLQKDQILLMRRYQTGFMDGCYCPPAGCIDGGESATAAMIREAYEEAGIILLKKDLRPAAVIHRCQKNDAFESVAFFFIATTWQGIPFNKEPDKCDDMGFFPLKALPENVPPYIQAGIKASLEGPFFLEWDF